MEASTQGTPTIELKDLQKAFSEVSLPNTFVLYLKHLAHSDGSLIGPYLPFVGPLYNEHRILFYLTAQNLSDQQNDLVRKYCAYGTCSLRRLEYKWDGEAPVAISSPRIHSSLDLGPVSGGVIPAVLATYLKARHGIETHDVDVAMSHMAVTNFYKLSLMRNGRDLNPNALKEDALPYTKLMFETFVMAELWALKPKTVFCFKGKSSELLREALAAGKIGPFELIELNDTAWILRGGGKCLQKGGSWDHRVPELDSLLSSFDDWYGWSYKGEEGADQALSQAILSSVHCGRLEVGVILILTHVWPAARNC